MLHRSFSITVTAIGAACVLAGCSAGDGAQNATARVGQGNTVQCGPGNPGGGTMTVTLLDFDPRSLRFTAFSDVGMVTLQYSSDTIPLAADLNEYPPDPIYPCTSDATTYDQVIGAGVTRSVVQTLADLAWNSCNASVSVTSNGSITSFQPVP